MDRNLILSTQVNLINSSNMFNRMWPRIIQSSTLSIFIFASARIKLMWWEESCISGWKSNILHTLFWKYWVCGLLPRDCLGSHYWSLYQQNNNFLILQIRYIYTVSAWLQPQGSIFQNGFLGGGQFKKSLKKWTFWAKSGGLLRKTPKNWTLHITWGSIE